jgi:hypothetical protein
MNFPEGSIRHAENPSSNGPAVCGYPLERFRNFHTSGCRVFDKLALKRNVAILLGPGE